MPNERNNSSKLLLSAYQTRSVFIMDEDHHNEQKKSRSRIHKNSKRHSVAFDTRFCFRMSRELTNFHLEDLNMKLPIYRLYSLITPSPVISYSSLYRAMSDFHRRKCHWISPIFLPPKSTQQKLNRAENGTIGMSAFSTFAKRAIFCVRTIH